MKPQEWDFTLALRVYDAKQLLAAAMGHADATEAQMTEADFRDGDGNIDISACLIMLLDPGSVPGCEIHDSTAERPEGTTEDEEEQ